MKQSKHSRSRSETSKTQRVNWGQREGLLRGRGRGTGPYLMGSMGSGALLLASWVTWAILQPLEA